MRIAGGLLQSGASVGSAVGGRGAKLACKSATARDTSIYISSYIFAVIASAAGQFRLCISHYEMTSRSNLAISFPKFPKIFPDIPLPRDFGPLGIWCNVLCFTFAILTL
jgi:hypothetical protein